MLVTPYKPLFFAPSSLLPAGFSYPSAYIQFATESGTAIIGSGENEWSVVSEAEMQRLFEHVQRVSPAKVLVPFMRSYGDQPSVACFSTELNAPVYHCSLAGRGTVTGGRISFSQWAAEVASMDGGHGV